MSKLPDTPTTGILGNKLTSILYFLDLVEEGPFGPKVSGIKIAFWVTTLFNLVTLASQTDWKILVGSGIANGICTGTCMLKEAYK